jgi:hypothetical protein
MEINVSSATSSALRQEAGFKIKDAWNCLRQAHDALVELHKRGERLDPRSIDHLQAARESARLEDDSVYHGILNLSPAGTAQIHRGES